MVKATKLNVVERLMLMPLLPQEGSFVTLRLVRTLVQKIGLSAEELKEFDVKESIDGDKKIITWNKKGDMEKELKFEDKEVEVIVKALNELNGKEKLSQREFSLYEKFCAKNEEV